MPIDDSAASDGHDLAPDNFSFFSLLITEIAVGILTQDVLFWEVIGLGSRKESFE